MLIFIAGCSKGGLDVSLGIGGEIDDTGERVVEDLVSAGPQAVKLEEGGDHC